MADDSDPLDGNTEPDALVSPLGDDLDTPPASSAPRRSKSDSADTLSDLDDLAKVDSKLAQRRIKLEELRFKLEERKADHSMLLDMRREDFREAQFDRDRDMLTGANENWMKTYWRPAAGWIYLVICFMDFVGFPLLSMIVPLVAKGMGFDLAYTPWVSLTLTQGGLIHLAFGAILGVAAWTRGQEKVAVVRNNIS